MSTNNQFNNNNNNNNGITLINSLLKKIVRGFAYILKRKTHAHDEKQ